MLLFTEEELSVSPAKNPYLTCEKCGLYRGCLTPYMPAAGRGEKKILLIGEAPDANEDREGRPFIGKAGYELSMTLKANGIDMDRDCIRTNACICRPPGNSTPSKTQIEQCRRFLFQTIEEFKPRKIITVGQPALDALIGHRVKVGAMADWAGFSIPDQTIGAWIFPTYHPSYVLREEEKNKAVRTLFESHIKNAVEHTGSFYETNYQSDVMVIRDLDEAERMIKTMMESDGPIAFDYETTGLKPYNKGHKVVTASMSDGLFSISFPMRRVLHDTWVEFLTNDQLKIAHNLKFEEMWSRHFFGVRVNNWEWDTMIAAHIIDNRRRITSLKRQSYLNLGISGYEDKIKKYLISDDGANGFNRIEECPIDDLLLYGGEDSLYTHKLYGIQKPIIDERFPDAMDLFMRSLLHFSDFEETGIRADREYFEDAKRQAENHIAEAMEKIREHPKVWKGFEGKPAEVAELLYDRLGYTPPEGVRTTKADFLETIDEPVVKNILEYRKWFIASHTFLEGFLREISEDSQLHCMFKLNTVTSYRGSSGNPNFQNIPKRDKEVMTLLRSGLYPLPGHQLWEYDFKSVEVCISACYHQDPEMIKYIIDPSSDMHRDQACEIFFRESNEFNSDDRNHKALLKDERYLAKNGFVFPQFYGDYYVNCAKSMWDRMKSESKAHLRSEGIKNLADFTGHVERVETRFWKQKFAVYDAWKERNWRQYQKLGYVDFYTGFRVGGIMSRNQVNNLAIQGTAFHVLLETVDYTKRRTRTWDSKVMGQIHDSMIWSQCPEESELISGVFAKALGHVKKKWEDWLIVPLVIETECAPTDEPWSKIEEVGKIESA